MPAWETDGNRCRFKARQRTAAFGVVAAFDKAGVLAGPCASAARMVPGRAPAGIGDCHLRRAKAVWRMVSQGKERRQDCKTVPGNAASHRISRLF